MLDGVQAHILVFAGTQILPLFAAGTPQQYICLHRSFSRRSRPPPFPTPPPPAALRTDNNVSTSEEAGYLGRLRSSTRPKLDDRETGRARSRSRDLRMGEPPEGRSGGEPENGPSGHHPGSPTKRINSPVRAAEKANQPPPGSGRSRRQFSPAPREPHQLASPRSTEDHRRHIGYPRLTERHP